MLISVMSNDSLIFHSLVYLLHYLLKNKVLFIEAAVKTQFSWYLINLYLNLRHMFSLTADNFSTFNTLLCAHRNVQQRYYYVTNMGTEFAFCSCCKLIFFVFLFFFIYLCICSAHISHFQCSCKWAEQCRTVVDNLCLMRI
jgi:hypothetical protein